MSKSRCNECGDTVDPDDGGPDHVDYCKGSPDDRLSALAERIEALEAQGIRTVHRAMSNPSDSANGGEVVGYFVKAEAARAAVKGTSYFGSNGSVCQVAVVVDSDGNVFELQPSRGSLVE